MDKFSFTQLEKDKIGDMMYGQIGTDTIDYFIQEIETLISSRADGDGSTDLISTEWQKCPKCDGQGIVSRPPWIAGDVYEWAATSVSHQCNVCNGQMIIPQPPKTAQQ